jgi:hypothetical protein
MLTTPVAPADPPPPPPATVKAYQRRLRFTGAEGADESALRSDDSVPVQELLLSNAEVKDLPPAAYEVMSEKVTDRRAPRPGASGILK